MSDTPSGETQMPCSALFSLLLPLAMFGACLSHGDRQICIFIYWSVSLRGRMFLRRIICHDSVSAFSKHDDMRQTLKMDVVLSTVLFINQLQRFVAYILMHRVFTSLFLSLSVFLPFFPSHLCPMSFSLLCVKAGVSSVPILFPMAF